MRQGRPAHSGRTHIAVSHLSSMAQPLLPRSDEACAELPSLRPAQLSRRLGQQRQNAYPLLAPERMSRSVPSAFPAPLRTKYTKVPWQDRPINPMAPITTTYRKSVGEERDQPRRLRDRPEGHG